MAGIPTQRWDWRGGTRRKKWEGGEGRAPPQSSDLEGLGCSKAVTEDPSASGSAGGAIPASPSKARSHFPCQPISSLLALIPGRAWGVFFFPRFGGKNPSNPKALSAVQVVFLGNELFPSSSGAQSVALCALPAIEELGSLLGATIPLQAAVPGDFRGVFCSVCGNERGARLAAVPAAGVVHFEPHKTVYFEFLASF